MMGSNLGAEQDARQLYSQGVELLKQKDYDAAGDAVTRAAAMGDAAAQCHLGFLYEHGFFGEEDAGEAVRSYRQAADQGLPHGQYRLGMCHQRGKGVEQNQEEAARLFELAAKMGHADAAKCLAELRAVPSLPKLPRQRNDPAVSDAVAAYQSKAIQNHTPSQLKLGLAYHLGKGAPLNPKLACFWVMRAMLAGDYTAAEYLQYCARGISAEQYHPLQSQIFQWAPGEPVPEL